MTQPDFAAIRADQVAEALTKIEAEPAWHRPAFKGVHSLMSLMDTPAQCSCGESWDQGIYAVGHAYSANAILEERLSTYLTALVEVAEAAEVVRVVGWDGVSWFDHPEHKGSCITYADDELLTDALDKLNAALDALTKAVEG